MVMSFASETTALSSQSPPFPVTSSGGRSSSNWLRLRIWAMAAKTALTAPGAANARGKFGFICGKLTVGIGTEKGAVNPAAKEGLFASPAQAAKSVGDIASVGGVENHQAIGRMGIS